MKLLHSKEDIRHIAGRLRSMAKSLEKIADDMESCDCEKIELQSETILNTRLPYIEKWASSAVGNAGGQIHEFKMSAMRRKTMEELRDLQNDIAEYNKRTAEKAQKSRKSPAKRKK